MVIESDQRGHSFIARFLNCHQAIHSSECRALFAAIDGTIDALIVDLRLNGRFKITQKGHLIYFFCGLIGWLNSAPSFPQRLFLPSKSIATQLDIESSLNLKRRCRRFARREVDALPLLRDSEAPIKP